ncbi:hypothetical protein GOODEAATRI_014467 [Goodea atripinnis]|uniref:Mediator of RNA polymerase II transcription subunit 23 n=1 Tax=Goodea atripinnis TaxID=208336 RepID=A0ABV0PYQ9_9TELE
MAGKSPGPFPNCDWRFNEFPNPAAHALHVTCVELMALAVPGKDLSDADIRDRVGGVSLRLVGLHRLPPKLQRNELQLRAGVNTRRLAPLIHRTALSDSQVTFPPFIIWHSVPIGVSRDIGVAFYEMLQAVDQHCQHLSYMDPICDFLYHIKYMYTGDSVKEQVSLCRR